MTDRNPQDGGRFRRHIITLWLGQVLSAVGDRLHEVALVWFAVEALGARAGWVVAAGSVARLLFGLPAGALADRWDRQHAMIAADLLRMLAVASLAIADLQAPTALWHLAGVAVVVGMMDSLFQPALQASLPTLAPDAQRLQVANAWLDITRRLAFALGPGATGMLLALFPLQQFFTIDAVTFGVSALLIRTLGRGYAWRPAARAAHDERRALHREIGAAARLAAADRTLAFGLGQNALWNVGLSPALGLGLALLVNQELRGGPELLGYLVGAYGVGNVLSNLVLTRVVVRDTARTLLLGGLVAAVGWISVALAPSVPLMLVLIALTAIGGPMADLMLLRIIQTRFPADQIGKIFSFRYTISRSGQAIGLALAVPLYAALGVRQTLIAAGVVLATYSLVALGLVKSGAGSDPSTFGS